MFDFIRAWHFARIMALLAAVIFRVLGFVECGKGKLPILPLLMVLRALLGSLWRLGLASVISFIGGMFVVGLLADTLFMLNVKGFFGVSLLMCCLLSLCPVLFYRFVSSNEGYLLLSGEIAEPIRYKHVFVWEFLQLEH